MEEKSYKFFAMQINGRDAMLVSTYQEVLEAIEDRLAIDDSDVYSVERIDGIYELIRRMGAFEDYDDDWMLDVLDTVSSMVKRTAGTQESESKESVAASNADGGLSHEY